MNDFSVQPVQEHLLMLAETRLRNHPGMFQMLKHKLATGSPRALMILDCLVPGEWVFAAMKGRDFFSIDEKLKRAIDSWVNSHPTSKTVVVPLPAPYMPATDSDQVRAVTGKNDSAGANTSSPVRKFNHYLHKFIMQAQSSCTDKNDMTEVMMELQKIADAMVNGTNHGKPFVGSTAGGVKYKNEDLDPTEFNKKQLTAYLRGSNLKKKRP